MKIKKKKKIKITRIFPLKYKNIIISYDVLITFQSEYAFVWMMLHYLKNNLLTMLAAFSALLLFLARLGVSTCPKGKIKSYIKNLYQFGVFAIKRILAI